MGYGVVSSWDGFFSYVHADDKAEGGRITRLASDIKGQFEMSSGESISIFLDKNAVRWGDKWREQVDSGLESVAFFIPVLTPRYFRSPECRREFQSFARQASKFGLKGLVLPLLYVDVPELHHDSSSDDLICLVREFHWVDWRELRFSECHSAEYRRAIVGLSARLIDVNHRAVSNELEFENPSVSGLGCEVDDDSPGVLDKLARAEEAMPEWTKTLDSIAKDIELVGRIISKGNEEVRLGDTHGKGYAARLLVARKLVPQLTDPVARIQSGANQFVSQLHDVDEGIRVIIGQAPEELEASPESKEDICGFFNAVRSLTETAGRSLDSVQGMVEAIAPIEKMSRDLRPVFRFLRQALTEMLEAREVTQEWVRMLDESNIICAGGKAGPESNCC